MKFLENVNIQSGTREKRYVGQIGIGFLPGFFCRMLLTNGARGNTISIYLSAVQNTPQRRSKTQIIRFYSRGVPLQLTSAQQTVPPYLGKRALPRGSLRDSVRQRNRDCDCIFRRLCEYALHTIKGAAVLVSGMACKFQCRLCEPVIKPIEGGKAWHLQLWVGNRGARTTFLQHHKKTSANEI